MTNQPDARTFGTDHLQLGRYHKEVFNNRYVETQVGRTTQNHQVASWNHTNKEEQERKPSKVM